MKKKGFCFKRAVSLFLAAVMIVTAAPQTSLTALAAEQGMTTDTPDVSEGLDILTTEDGTSVETGDTEPSKSEGAAGQDGTDASGDIGDESADVPSDNDEGVGDDEQAGDPDNADQSDNAGDNTDDPDGVNQGDDAGDSDETANPEEGMDEDLTTDDESVSGNDLEGVMSVFGDGTDGDEDEGPAYMGMIDTSEGYRRLIIDESKAEASAGIDAILEYYKNQSDSDKFNCVEFNVGADSDMMMKAAYINGAISIMDTGNEEIGYWIDYNFWINAAEGVRYAMHKPDGMANDIDAKFTVELMPHQGVKINAKATKFPGEFVSVTYSIDTETEGDAFAECWDGAKQETLRLLALNGNDPAEIIEYDGISYSTYTYGEGEETGYGSLFDMSIEGIQAGQDYLITPLYRDNDSVPMGTTKTLTAGERSGSPDGTGVTEVTWKSLDESLIKIAAGTGADATLTAKDTMGEAYYYVTYKRGGEDWLELHSIRVAYAVSDGTLKYIGEVIENRFEDEHGEPNGDLYLRLVIDEAEALEQNKDKNITPILEFWKDNDLQVNCVQFDMMDESPSQRKVKKDYINDALSVMDTKNTENIEVGRWIDYNFWNEETETGVNFTLGSPYEAVKDVNATFTLTDLANKGLKVKFADTAFPAENVSLSYNQSGVKYQDSLWIKDNPFRLFTHSSGTPKAMVDINEEQGWGYYNTYGDGEDARTDIHFNNIKPLGTTEYLAASIYEDEERPEVGTTVQLTAGKRADRDVSATSAAWKLFDADKATIDKNGKLTAWSDLDPIYYYVTYKVGSAQYLEVHEMNAQSQHVEIYFDEDNITMELNTDPNADPAARFLRLRFKPSDAERNTHNPEEILWEFVENGTTERPIIDFVYYDNDWNKVEKDAKDEEGNPLEGVAPNGEIIALNEGTAKVKVSYLDVEKGEPIPTATCTVKVVRPLWDDKMEETVENFNLYAVMDLDTKLSDIEQQLGAGWKWVDPDTSLTNFKGMDGSQFPAVYTAEDGRTVSASPWVRFVTVTGIEIGSKNENQAENNGPEWYEEWVPDSIGKGEKVTLGYSYTMENLDWTDEEIGRSEYDTVKKRMEAKYQIEWTSNPADALKQVDDGYQFTAPSIDKAKKYTFTVSVKDKKKKVYLKNSCAITVTVTDNPKFDWDKVGKMWVAPDPDSGEMFLRFDIYGMTEAEYNEHPLTVVSEDPAILKLKNDKTFPYPEEGKDSEGNVYTNVVVPCTNLKKGEYPKPGTAWIRMTAKDEINSTRRFCLEFIDREPKLMVSAVTINQALTDKIAYVTVRTHMQYPIDTGKVTLQLDGKDTNDVAATVIGSTTIGSEEDKNNSYYDYNIQLTLKANAKVKKKNTVKLNLVVNPAEGAETKAASESYSLKLTLNVTNTVPKVTFKQAKKVNLFYNDEEGDGILNVTGADIRKLELTDCDFTVRWDDELEGYRIVPNNRKTVSDKKGTLSYEIDSYSNPIKTNFTVSVETKKPTIVLSQKSDTLYPLAEYKNSWLWMTDKATGEEIRPSEVKYVKNKSESPTLPIEPEEIDFENRGDWLHDVNAGYDLIANDDGAVVFRLQDQKTYKKKTNKFSLKIKEANWNDSIAVSYSIKVDTAKPKLVLGKSTLTLNKNEAVYRAQQEGTSLHLKGTSGEVYPNDEWNWVRFDGQDEKSKKILRTDNRLVLKYEDNPRAVIVRFNDNKMDPGTYKFKVSVGNNGVGLISSTVLTVKIVDVPIAKTLKVTAKGSIDVMNREGTSIAYTPKISNISGKVVHGRLEGMDSDLFENWWDGSKLIVQARYGTTYNTKYTYRVHAVFEVETEGYDNLTVSTANPLNIKVKQGKPKLTASTAGNTIYRQLDNTVDIKLSAMLNKQEVDIEDVQLLNFTDDFGLTGIPVSYKDDDGTVHEEEWIYNPETKSVRLGLNSRYDAHDVIKSGKTYKVKLAVRYCNQAGNEKEAQVTCSIVVR